MRVYFHIINQQHPETSADQAFQILNTAFNGRNIFFEWDCHVDYIDNFVPDETLVRPERPVFNINNHEDGIDIYLFDKSVIETLGGSANGVGESSELAIFDADVSTAPLAHEMGHVLNLYHTHWLFFCRETPRDSCFAQANPSVNSLECGDLVADTPADPNLFDFEGEVDEDDCTIPNDLPLPIFTPEGTTTLIYKCTDPKNFMSHGPKICRTKFSDGQIIRVKNSIQLLPFLQACLLDDQPHNILSDVTIDNHQAYYNDVIIHNGATLTIESTVSLREGKEIIVEEGGKLIVKGEISNYCDEFWGGIKVVGRTAQNLNPNHVDVEFNENLNGERSVISNVQTIDPSDFDINAAVTMLPPDQLFSSIGNGVINAENTDFINCPGMVKFAGEILFDNSSSVTDCTQDSGIYGIRNVNCNGILVSECTFNDILMNSVTIENGSMTLDENEFESGQEDVVLTNVIINPFNSIIINNNFRE